MQSVFGTEFVVAYQDDATLFSFECSHAVVRMWYSQTVRHYITRARNDRVRKARGQIDDGLGVGLQRPQR